MYKEIAEWIKALAIAALIVFVIRQFVFAPFVVDGPSMQPNFYTGERLIVNKIIYSIRNPHRGEVVVFHVPAENRDFIKRVIALPGDKVSYVGDTLIVNDKVVEEKYLSKSLKKALENGSLFNNGGDLDNFPNENVKEAIVPAGHLLAFGDNRPNSKDSRMIGFVSYDDVIGRADIIFWPLNNVSFVNND